MNPLAALQQMSLYPQGGYQELLSEEQLKAARMHGLLGAGAGMLASGGWSPQKRTFGQQLGQGFMQGSQMQGQAMGNMARMEMMKQQMERQNAPKWDERRIGDKVVQGYAYPDGSFEQYGEGNHFKPDAQWRAMTPEELAAYGAPQGARGQINTNTGKAEIRDPKNPDRFTVWDGPEARQMERDPRTGQVKQIGGGPRYGRTEQDAAGDIPTTQPQSIVPPDIDASQASGLGGFLRGTVNTLGDAFGMGLAYPDAEQARFAMNNLKLYTVTALQAPIPGRPSVHLQQMIEKNTVEPNKILMGEGRAISSYTQMKHTIDTEIARMERDVLSRPMPQSKRNEVEDNYSQLRQLSKSYDEAIKSFGSKSGEAPAVSPDVDSILKKRGL